MDATEKPWQRSTARIYGDTEANAQTEAGKALNAAATKLIIGSTSLTLAIGFIASAEGIHNGIVIFMIASLAVGWVFVVSAAYTVNRSASWLVERNKLHPPQSAETPNPSETPQQPEPPQTSEVSST